jgi:hypothetical protein
MSSQERTIANIRLFEDRPTDLTFKDLHTWVIWQFPRKRGQWLCGAVRPPIAKHCWLPALIDPVENLVQIQGQSENTFETPDEALDWLVRVKTK